MDISQKMRRFGIAAAILGGIGVVLFGALLTQMADDPKASIGWVKWSFILATALSGMGVFVLSLALSAGKGAGRRDG